MAQTSSVQSSVSLLLSAMRDLQFVNVSRVECGCEHRAVGEKEVCEANYISILGC